MVEPVVVLDGPHDVAVDAHRHLDQARRAPTTRAAASHGRSRKSGCPVRAVNWNRTGRTRRVARRAGRPRLALHRPGRQPADEVALQREEHDQRHGHRDERAGGQQVPVLARDCRSGRRSSRGHDLTVLAAAEEDQRDQQVVPDPQELEDREGRQRPGPTAAPSAARTPGSGWRRRPRADSTTSRGQRADVVAQQVDRQRHPEAGVGEPDAPGTCRDPAEPAVDAAAAG